MNKLYATAEVNQLKLLLEEMVQHSQFYLSVDIEDVAIQYHAAVICEEIDREIFEEMLTQHSKNRG